jgi:TolB-like protein/Tfp pilus assembly protein PilF
VDFACDRPVAAMIRRFGDCEVDTDRCELRRGGAPVAVEPQVFELLAYLVAHPDRVVSKDELNKAIWNGRVVSDSALSSRIKSARQAIGDDGKAQTLIRTVHGRGFRFVGAAASPQAPAAGAVPHERPVVAVIPFDNLSSDANEDYFADGVTADIIATLAKHRWLSVVARNTTLQYKGRAAGIAEIARETGADYVVEGSVRRVGPRVRVGVQLIDAAGGNCLWTERYDRQSEDLFEIQDNITQTVAARIEPEIGYEERRRVESAAGSRDLRAWECFHLGVSHFFKFTGPDNVKAQDYLQCAREQDPNFGDAHAWWAYAVVLGTVYWDTDPAPERLDQALAATTAALERDDENAVFYALKARVQLARGEYESAIEGNRIAIELNPSFAAAHCGLADSLTFLGRYDEAVVRFENAIALSTNDPQRWAFYTYGALALIFRGDYARAIEWTERAAEIPNRQYWTLAHKAVALAYSGRSEDARRTLLAARAEQPALSVAFARKKLYYIRRPEQLDHYLAGLALAGAPSE